MIRAFFGLAVDDRLGAELARAARTLKPAFGAQARWVARRNYHLTLAFLGNIGDDDRPLLHDMARRITADLAPFDIGIHRIGWFPSARRARMVAALVRRGHALVALSARLRAALAARGFAVDGRPLHPHITLARIRSVPVETPAWPGLNCCQRISALVLFRSDRVDNTVVYNPLFESRFDGGEHKA